MKKINLETIKKNLLRKKVFIPVLCGFGVFLFFIFRSNQSDILSLDTVRFEDLFKSVRATGQVVSNTELKLSFNKGGIVKSVKVSVGNKVKQGAILANLDQGDALSRLTQMKASLLAANAKYTKLVEGASNEEINLARVSLKSAETNLENVKNNQAIFVANAYRNLLNSNITAYAYSSQNDSTTPTISGTYVLGKEGEIRISVSPGGAGGFFNASGLVNAIGNFSSTTPQPIGNSGLYVLFSSNSSPADFIISIPNKKATSYLENYNSYKNALETEKSSVETAQATVDEKRAQLDLKLAVARTVDLDIAEADVLSAQGALQAAQSAYEDTIIRAPASGTITKVDVKYGELAEVGKPIITLEDVDNLYIEAMINEANIAYLKIGQNVDLTFDAFGSDKKFTGLIMHIDPSAECNTRCSSRETRRHGRPF
jgi:multidrug resistance efflux pump